MKEGVSVIIRNKNEAKSLDELLRILSVNYARDIDEIIVVDNVSTDNSKEIISKYNCKLVTIENFSYGRGINIGAENSSYNYCVLLSSHVIPVGTDFFKNINIFFDKQKDAAGLRFCRNISDANNFYNSNNCENNLNTRGLLASGSVFKKSIWNTIKFDENLIAAEDKDWSKKVLNKGYKIYLIPSVYFYVNTRNWKQEANKYKVEKTAHFQIFKTETRSSFYNLLQEIYRAALIFTNRIKLVFSRFWTDITFKKNI